MRIAVIQLAIDFNRRTSNLQHALASIDEAAGHDPAPDFVLLPAFCDVAEAIAGLDVRGERLEGQTKAAIAGRARQWGVYAGYGFAERTDGGLVNCSVLLDSDGDTVTTRRSQLKCTKPSESSSDQLPGVTSTILGSIMIVTCADIDQLVEPADSGFAKPDVIVCSGGSLSPSASASDVRSKLKKKLASAAKACKSYCVLADTVVSTPDRKWAAIGASSIFTPDGKVVADAKAKEAAILWVDVSVSSSPMPRAPLRD